MKKIILQILLCSVIVSSNVLVDTFPILQNFTKKRICEIETDSILTHPKVKKWTAHLSKEEKEELIKLKEFQKDLCNH